MMDMYKIVHFMQLIFVFVLSSYSEYLNAVEIEFVRCQSLNYNPNGDLLVLDISLESKILCGTKCTEHLDLCWSYAWNSRTKHCVLYSQKCFTMIVSEQQAHWEEYVVRECVADLENGVLSVTNAFIPETTISGVCNPGYVALSGHINLTCNAGYTTSNSDVCRLVLTDIAVGKPSLQSSMYATFSASLAVDGVRNPDATQNSCSHTDLGDLQPWWRVDLQSQFYVLNVRILNRGMDQYGIDESSRLRDVTVNVGLTADSINTFCGFFAGPGTLSQLVIVQCQQHPLGRFVQISLVSEFLTLCEVDVIVANV